MFRKGQGFIVCLYGMYDPNTRSKIEMTGYTEYLEACAEFIAEYKTRDKVVILAGGRTTKSKLSEAKSVEPVFTKMIQDAFRALGHKYVMPRILLEESSLNTVQNISKGASRLNAQEIVSAVIIVDHPRHQTAYVIAQHPDVMPCLTFRWEVKSFPRRDSHPNSTLKRQLWRSLNYLVFPKRIKDKLNAKPRVSK